MNGEEEHRHVRVLPRTVNNMVWVRLGLELQYFFGARRSRPRVPEREESEELLLVRDGDDELWIPYAGESPTRSTSSSPRRAPRPRSKTRSWPTSPRAGRFALCSSGSA